MNFLAKMTKLSGAICIAFILLAGNLVQAQTIPGEAVESILQDGNETRLANEVLVLGSTHLQAYSDQLRPEHLYTTLEQLERFAPTAIAIERLSTDEVALLAEYAGDDSVADILISQFASITIEYGQAMQQALDISRIGAAQKVDKLFKVEPEQAEERLQLIKYLLAAYDYESAVLQWSYLSEQQQALAELPENIKETFNRYLQSGNEIITVALSLAQRLNIQRLIPVDSHFEGLRTLAYPQDELGAVFGHAKLTEMRESEAWIELHSRPDQALQKGDLLPLFQYQNSYQGQLEHAMEWRAWASMEHESGLDKFRYAMWELRNQRMATNILNAATGPEQKRLLVLVGAGHKSFLDRALHPYLSIKLRQFAEYDNVE